MVSPSVCPLAEKSRTTSHKAELFLPSPISPAHASEIFPRPLSGWMTPYDPKTTYGVVPCSRSRLVLCLYAMTLCRVDWHIFDKVLGKIEGLSIFQIGPSMHIVRWLGSMLTFPLKHSPLEEIGAPRGRGKFNGDASPTAAMCRFNAKNRLYFYQ